MAAAPTRRRPWLAPGVVFALTAGVYVAVAGPRVLGPSEHQNNHFAHLADSWLHGRLDVLLEERGREVPPGRDDWACYDTAIADGCGVSPYQRPRETYRWYVSFPPLPAVILLPLVAVTGGTDFPDPLVWAVLAGLAPALLLVLLGTLRDRGHSERSVREDLILVTVFAFGSVYFFTAVQGSVWFAAHVVACSLLVLFLWAALDARRPLWAGVALGLCFLTRPSTAPFALFFLFEVLRVHRSPAARADDTAQSDTAQSDTARSDTAPDEAGPLSEGLFPRLARWLRPVRWRSTIRPVLTFFAPILACGGLAMAHNLARFGDPFSFGHRYLVIRWTNRIRKWGLFHYHYLPRNLGVVVASLPWLSRDYPYLVKVSRHGLALWLTSPNLLWALFPRTASPLFIGLAIPTAIVFLIDLLYQNTGWVQFGYRFSLDFMPAAIVLLALSKRRLGGVFALALAFAVALNLAGALSFNRAAPLYDDDPTQNRIFQPD